VILVVTIYIVVTIEIVTTTILVCWGYINKTFCWGNKVFFSVSLIFLNCLLRLKKNEPIILYDLYCLRICQLKKTNDRIRPSNLIQIWEMKSKLFTKDKRTINGAHLQLEQLSSLIGTTASLAPPRLHSRFVTFFCRMSKRPCKDRCGLGAQSPRAAPRRAASPGVLLFWSESENKHLGVGFPSPQRRAVPEPSYLGDAPLASTSCDYTGCMQHNLL